MEFLLLSLLAVVLFVMVSLRRQGEDLASLTAIDHAGSWLDDRDINRDVRFVTYSGRPYAELDGATVVVGHGTDTDGRAVGFCVEVMAPHGTVAGILVHPASIVREHRQIATHSRRTGIPLRAALAVTMIRRT